jgi:hypothetical protein
MVRFSQSGAAERIRREHLHRGARAARRWPVRSFAVPLLAAVGALTVGDAKGAPAGGERSESQAVPGAVERVSLGWARLPGAESCVDPQTLAVGIERRLGRAVLVSAPEADVFVEASVGPEGSGVGWEVRIALVSKGEVLGRRELKSQEESCRAVCEQAELVIALMIDPEAALRQPRESREAAPLAPSGSAVADRVSAAESWRWRMTIGMPLALGFVPGPATALMLRTGVKAPDLPMLNLHGAYWFGRDVQHEDGTGVAVSLVSSGVSVCPFDLSRQSIGGALCGGLEGGVLRVQGVGFDLKQSEERYLFNATLHVIGTYRVWKPWIAEMGAGLAVPIVRDRFLGIEPDGSLRELFRMAPVSGWIHAAVGVELR